jgi:preprotein translocase subunit SecG
MIIFFLILVILASVAIALFILVQNPKGGGLSGTFAGFNSQFMGVKQTTDVLEKGTWVMATVIGLLCLFSAVFISDGTTARQVAPRPNTQQSAPAPTQSQQPPAPAPGN